MIGTSAIGEQILLERGRELYRKVVVLTNCRCTDTVSAARASHLADRVALIASVDADFSPRLTDPAVVLDQSRDVAG